MTQTKKSESLAAPLWRLLASIRLTVVLLLLLAATSIVGTLIPQGGDPSDYIRQYGDTGYRLMYVFDLFDMYHSWWFRGLIILLTANILFCTWKRFPAVWKMVVAGKPSLPAKPTEARGVIEFTASSNQQELKAHYETYIDQRFTQFRTDPIENGFRIIAEKGRWTRLGVPGVHLSIVILLAGAMIGSLFGFDGYVNIAEGERVDRVRLRNSGTFVSLGFEILCEDFNVSFYDTGAPKEYRSRLQIIEEGRTVAQKDIIVNDPLRYKGINLFQSSYGSLPAKELTLSFSPKNGGEAVLRTVAVGQKVDIPGSELRFHLKEVKSNFSLRNMDAGETALGVLEGPDGRTTEVVLPMRFPTYDKMREGQWIVTVEDHDHAYYTGLQVTRDPGVSMVYAGFVLLIVGCFVAFFLGHEKVAVDVINSTHSSTVRVYGHRSRRNSIGFENSLKKIAADLSGQG
ncbi:MAG: cytochrome c biogenesis protein ResB [Deltaproteobacteria bacterium]|nr:cytochrome c biogenesis protein ResB [Deltaproteobacteria bacterium]